MKTKHNQLFFIFLLSVMAVFFYLRPFKSEWHPFIAGDGIGYYAYLPALFIHDDANLKFDWFNDVYNQNYKTSSFNNPEDNFLVAYGDKKIDKYYQGLSFIWMPFFFIGHLFAKIFNYPQDGFSQPYQWSMALASLTYLLIGLLFLKRLLKLIFNNEVNAIIITGLIFFGTPLFNYSIHYNTLSHVYSFSFIVLFIYTSYKFLNEEGVSKMYFLLACFFFFINIGIRPLNGLVLLCVPAYCHKKNLKALLDFSRYRLKEIFVMLLLALLLLYVFYLMYLQTGTFLPYTYSNERFDFIHNRFMDVLFGYSIGLFLYVPLIFISLFGILNLPNKRWLILPAFFFCLAFIYSAWWYWPINKRALIDYFFVPALLLGFLLNQQMTLFKRNALYGLLFVSVIFYQFKNYQIQNGILDEFNTYKEIYWQHFFRIHKAHRYLIDPSLIEKKEEYFFDFENEVDIKRINESNAFKGKKAICIGPQNNFIQLTELNYPALFNKNQQAIIRFSMQTFFEEEINKVHLFIQFFNAQHQSILDEPFYLNGQDLVYNEWDLNEFAYEITNHDLINRDTVKSIAISVWNLEAKKRIFVDNLKVEFIVKKNE